VNTLLAAEGIDVSMKARDGRTSLLFACLYGHAEIAKALVAAVHKKTSKFDFINDCDEDGDTALMFACEDAGFDSVESTGLDIFKLLLSVPTINIHAKNDGGMDSFDDVRANEDEIRTLFQHELPPSFFLSSAADK
jgi:ankyrin repeat protein